MTNRFYYIPEITTGCICVADFVRTFSLFCLEMKAKLDFFVKFYVIKFTFSLILSQAKAAIDEYIWGVFSFGETILRNCCSAMSDQYS